jgi:hypothetical protein
MKNPPQATTPEEEVRGSVPKSPTHCQLILEYLQAGHTLTGLEALDKFRCWALSQRITDLKKQGHRVTTTMITLPSGKRVAKYKLEQ